ncbi:MAG: hypothetical protein KKC76_06670, partial [Proteobacteria bacterium]|nr:hypothetical protein [Pseudomonadota bacterium]
INLLFERDRRSSEYPLFHTQLGCPHKKMALQDLPPAFARPLALRSLPNNKLINVTRWVTIGA